MLTAEILGFAAHLDPVADVAGHDRAELRRGAGRDSVRIVGARQEHRSHRATKYDPGDAPGTVPSDVAYDLRRSHGVTDQGDVRQIEPLDQGAQIVGQGVDVVARARPVGATVAAPVIGDTAQAPPPAGPATGSSTCPR